MEAPLANVCDVDHTSVAKIAKQWLPTPTGPVREVHARLRDVGRRYLAGTLGTRP